MRSIFTVLIMLVFSVNALPVYASPMDRLKSLISPEQAETFYDTDENTIVSALKEALSIGTENAVKYVSRVDGYFGNELIKILLPDNFKKIEDVAARMGFQQQVDNLVLSMNRAAETAAPKATRLFVEAIKDMSIEDAKGILQGGDTSATDFFRDKTYTELYDEFKPDIASSMNQVGVANAYKNLMSPVEKIPFLTIQPFDLEDYVTRKSLDGLFVMVEEEEKRIRSDPSARVTDLLKTVFGK